MVGIEFYDLKAADVLADCCTVGQVEVLNAGC